MLEDQFVFPGVIRGRILDAYLQMGWYRMGCMVFTTHYLAPFSDERKFRVYWLRYRVDSIMLGKSALRLLELDNRFSVQCMPFRITEELDALHKQYVASLKFQTSGDLANLLVDTANVVYDSYLVEVRDNGKLVAAGVFDVGFDSIEGIINFYHPDYKKYSLGKYVMLQKYKFCILNNISLYYPGYYMPEHPLFDYKLFIDKNATEVYEPLQDVWMPYTRFIQEHPYERETNNTSEIKKAGH